MKTFLLSLLCISFLGYGYYWYYQDKREQKFACQVDSDCIMSYRDVEDFQICVNNVYYNSGPQIEGQYQCSKDTALLCSCQQNMCVRSDQKQGCE